MRLAQTVRYGFDEELILAQQLGADGVIMRVESAAGGPDALSSAAYRARVSGMPLAGVELTGLPQSGQEWLEVVELTLRGAADAGIWLLLCRAPGGTGAGRVRELQQVAHAAVAADVALCLETPGLTPGEIPVWLEAGGRLEAVVGLPPLAPGPDLSRALVSCVASGGVEVIRLEGGGAPLCDAAADIPRCLLTLAHGRYAGIVRAGTPPLLVEDDDWRPKGAAADLGYLRAVLQSVT